MAEQNDIPETIAIRSPRTIAVVAEEFKADIDRTYTKAAEALIADGKRYRERLANSRRSRRREPAKAAG
jgi:hypothetical protein